MDSKRINGPLTEPLTWTELAELFHCHRNQVTHLILSKYPHQHIGRKCRMRVEDMPPSYLIRGLEPARWMWRVSKIGELIWSKARQTVVRCRKRELQWVLVPNERSK